MDTRRKRRRLMATGTLLAGSLSAVAAFGVIGQSAASGDAHSPSAPDSAASSCHLANGIQHVVEITFDNVHFFRDNPNVPSDLEMMPHLLNFLEQNGVMLSNNHTPLIAHTADDSLTTYTGLYGDRQGMPISNDYQTYNPDGSTDSAGSFAYWTDPVYDTASHPNSGHDTNPSMVYSATPPATTTPAPAPNTITPAPWVPFTRAGCNVGDVSTANMVLENTSVDIPKVFGSNSPEAMQLAADPDSFKDPETADYVGLAVHCAKGSAVCSSAKAVKYGQPTATPSAVDDVLSNEPGGYNGYQALFGHKYIAPQLGAGTPNTTHNGYGVTNAAGNLVDLNGNQINGAFLTNYPGFPGFSNINASQTLAYMADMLESNVPVVYGYISDIHGNENIPALASVCKSAPEALASGTPCYIAQAQYYDQAFETFFNRLAADGITAKNTLFVVSSDEGDHEAGANVGRALQPSPASCDGATVSGTTVTPDVACNYPAGTFGELDANVNGLLAQETGDTTAFSLEADTAPEFYVHGNPGPDTSTVRSFEHNLASLYASNPYSGNTHELITNYLADPAEEAILHMVNADPERTPTLAMFAKPDYYVSTGSSTCTNSTGTSSSDCVEQTTSFAWDHGDYAAEVDTNYLGLVGPGVAHLGLDGSPASAGPNSAGPMSGQETVPGSGTTGPWLDETDIRPTLMYLTGLRDDYTEDGRVVTQVLSKPGSGGTSSPAAQSLGACYKQLNSSVGEFGTATLEASTRAIESSSPSDSVYTSMDATLTKLDRARDQLAEAIKNQLFSAEFEGGHLHHGQVRSETTTCERLIGFADHLAIAG